MKEKEIAQVSNDPEPKKATGEVVVSPKNELIGEDWKVWFERAVLFVKPLLIMYLTYVIGGITLAITDKTFVVSTSYFVPNALVSGAMILYILNRIMDILNRYTEKITYKV